MWVPSVKDSGNIKCLQMLPSSSGPKTQILPKRHQKYSFSSCDAYPLPGINLPFCSCFPNQLFICFPFLDFIALVKAENCYKEGGKKKKAAFVKVLAASVTEGRALRLFVLPVTN